MRLTLAQKVPSENMIAAHRLFAAENYSCALCKGFERRLEAFFCLDGQETRRGGRKTGAGPPETAVQKVFYACFCDRRQKCAYKAIFKPNE